MSTNQDPPRLGYLWAWFCDLTDWRDSSMGIGPLSHQEITAWADLFRIKLQPCEVTVLRSLDRAFRNHHYLKNNPDKSEGGSIADGLKDLAAQNKAKKSAKKGGGKK